MSGAEDAETGDKPHEPTPRKLEEARKKGQIPRSQDLTTAAGYFGVFLALTALGSWSVRLVGTAATVLIDQPERLAPLLFGGSAAPVGGLLAAIGLGVVPWFLAPAIMALLSITAQRGFLFTGENLQPKLSRISPLAVAKQKFGRKGLFEFAKGAIKLMIVAAVLALYLAHEAAAILGLLALAPGQIGMEIGRLLAGFLVVNLLIAGTIAALDLLFQHIEHRRQNRMSHKELMDETKESEGDPHMKGARRQRSMDIATNRMLTAVPKADVVVVNPTHFAVALAWSREKGAAPVCVAKGTDEIAARIREAAAEAGVPIHRDPPTARALHATVDLGQEIRPEHYRAVAAAIRFAQAMRARARDRGMR